jgi:hypothetical protein
VFVAYAIGLVLLVYCALDVMSTPAASVRSLPKAVWFVVLVLLPVLGPLAWLFAGRPRRGATRGAAATERGAPDDDEDFLRELRRRADEHRRRARDPRDDGKP